MATFHDLINPLGSIGSILKFQDQILGLPSMQLQKSLDRMMAKHRVWENSLAFTRMADQIDRIANISVASKLAAGVDSVINSTALRAAERLRVNLNLTPVVNFWDRHLDLFRSIDSHSTRFFDGQSFIGRVGIESIVQSLVERGTSLIRESDADTIEALNQQTETLQKAIMALAERNHSDFTEAIALLRELLVAAKSGPKLWMTWLTLICTVFATGWAPSQFFVEQNQKTEKPSKTAKAEEPDSQALFDLMETKQFAYLPRRSRVFFNPSLQSRVVKVLEPGSEVTIITTRHKWALIMFVRDSATIPLTGWVLKKYLEVE